MGARGLLNLALAACAVVLGLVIYFRPGLEPGPAAPPLGTQVDAAEASAIDIERLTREPLSFRKREGHWQLVSNAVPLPAAEFQVTALLRILQTPALSSYPVADVDLAELGLQPAQASVSIDGFRILFGITESLENRRYLQVDDTVMLVTDQYQHLMNADWSNFVDRKLLPEGVTITRLQLPGLTLQPDENNRWQVTPEHAGIGADAIARLLQHWGTATALYVRPYDGAPAAETIRIESGAENAAIEFLLSARSPELVLARPDLGIQYHLGSGMGDSLLSLQEAAAQE